MRRLTGIAAAAAAVALLVTPSAVAGGGCATLRVETIERTVLGSRAPAVCSARSYLDSAGTAHALAASTAMGQLVSATGWLGLALEVTFSDQLGGFVSAIGGASGGSTGFWSLYVDNRFSQEGAETATVSRGDEIVWVLDPDFNQAGPEFLDLDIVRARGGVVVAAVTRVGEQGTEPARGATLRVNGRRVTVGASGRATVRLRSGSRFTAQATQAGVIRSEVVSGRA